MLQINRNIAAMVTVWYKSAVCRVSLLGAGREVRVNSGEDCIAGLPFHVFQQVLRVVGSAGSQFG
jgi:hypothetical protein